MKLKNLRNRTIDIVLQKDYLLYKAVCIFGINEELPMVHDGLRELWFDIKYDNDPVFQAKYHNGN